MNRFLLLPDIYNREAKATSLKLLSWFRKQGVKVSFLKETAKILGISTSSSIIEPSDITKKVNVLLTLGGDGTLLHYAQLSAVNNLPILGVNLGGLGFLAEVKLTNLEEALHKVINKEFELEKRMMLEITVKEEEEVLSQALALNDVTFSRIKSRSPHFKVEVNSEISLNYFGDGIIFATPTGSTAYSLSAGGPIINPRLECILITPICSHSLYHRPLLIPPGDKIRIYTLDPSRQVVISSDGREFIEFTYKQVAEVKKSSKHTTFIKLGTNFYKRLQEKLHWGGG